MVITCLLTGRLVRRIDFDFRLRRWQQLHGLSPAARNSSRQCECMVLSIVVDESDGPLYVSEAVRPDIVASATSTRLFCHKTMCLIPLYEGSESVLADAVENQTIILLAIASNC